jgi:hypothetical protein
LLEVSRAVRTTPEPPGPTRPCDLLLDGFALVFTDGRPAAAQVHDVDGSIQVRA